MGTVTIVFRGNGDGKWGQSPLFSETFLKNWRDGGTANTLFVRDSKLAVARFGRSPSSLLTLLGKYSSAFRIPPASEAVHSLLSA